MNCKKGDLAIILPWECDGFVVFEECIGIIVRVNEPYAIKVLPGIPAWLITSNIAIPRLNGTYGNLGALPDAALKPIRGLPATDDLTEESNVLLKELSNVS